MKRISLAELIDEVSEITGASSKDVRLIADVLFERIKSNLLLGNSVLVWRFGVFSVKEVKARRAHNVNSKTVVVKPRMLCPKLEFSRQFRHKF